MAAPVNDPAHGFCRDCLALQRAETRRCERCGSPRLARHAELYRLHVAHIDCDAFYAAIEKRDNPALKDRPVIVGGGKRGVVSTACYIARIHGVRSAMPMFKALEACPQAVVLPPNMEKYVTVGRQVRALMQELTPLVQPLSIDEAFLDLSGTERLHHAPPALTLARFARRIEACGADAVVLDALDAHHLRLIGEAIGRLAPTAFVVGSGGLSAAIADAAPRRPAPAAVAAASGPVLVVSGSRSPRTRRQTAAAADAGWFVAPLPRDDREAAPARDALRAGRSVVLASDLGPDDDGALDGLTRRAARIVRTAVAAGETRRVIVCGGDSSSRVVRLLGIRALSIAANPWGNVALLRAHADGPLDGVELLLKGGQVGDDDLFERVRTGGAP